MSFLASRVAAASVRALGSTLIVGCWLQHEKDRHARCETISQSPASSLEHTMQTIAGNPTYEAPNGKKTDNLFYNDGDSFPNLSRHGSNSLLKKYLTPDVYEQLKDKQTSAGVKLEDLIQGGIALPWGARPPRGIAGVYAGDAESYTTFSVLLSPLIEAHHKALHRARLRRHRTNLDVQGLSQRRLDGAYILYTRMRLARSLNGFKFAPCIGRSERRAVERLLRDCSRDWPQGSYISLMEMSNNQHEDLVKRQLLFADPDEFAISTGMGRDWPDGRGIYCDSWDDLPHIMMWVNAQDHLWIISNAKGGDVQGVFTRLSMAVRSLEKSLNDRGQSFVEDPNLGFLNASPVDIGTALRASLYVKLVRLGQKPGFDELVRRLRLEARPLKFQSQTYTGMFDIANLEALGKTEVDLINLMIEGVGTLIDLEKRLENGEDIDIEAIAQKKGSRK
ncbi:creatine kinase [Fistulifera solaris]|uniref:Creatine kinase n=1 Tax=Fistulifera solaris TaxID=1519565 RepID=A0A1Z5JI58_FISSO|nr:creatine kinase [Fistulifera solaris]|eukprot:GAX13687.1 creatine kinase [Fistulifera solaris]